MSAPMFRRSAMAGYRLGTAQAHALVGPPAALVLMAFDCPGWALLFVITTAMGWLVWHRDFGLKWRLEINDLRRLGAFDEWQESR